MDGSAKKLVLDIIGNDCQDNGDLLACISRSAKEGGDEVKIIVRSNGISAIRSHLQEGETLSYLSFVQGPTLDPVKN